jgi:uncharacterized cupredoxin-like copper-binding protein
MLGFDMQGGPQMRTTPIALFALALAAGQPALAAGGGDHTHGHGHGGMRDGIGHPADPAKADRVIEVTMTDNAFSREEIRVKAGRTVTFKLRNAGDFVHEFSLGTKAMHEAHQEEMQHMMAEGTLTPRHMAEGGHHHGSGNSVMLNPGETGQLTWQFESPMTISFACNVPGHFQAGMHGPLTVRPPE